MHRELKRGDLLVTAVAVLLAGALAGHGLLPEGSGISQLVESFLPWLAVPVVLLAVVAGLLRSRIGLCAALLPALVCAVLVVPDLVVLPEGGTGELRVATQNLGAGGNAAELTGNDLVSLQEVTDRNRTAVARTLRPKLRYHVDVGTVGLWSRYPVSAPDRLDLGQGWPRALRATVHLPDGPATVYAAHLASVRFGDVERRNRTLTELTELITSDRSPRLILLGDLNTASTDRALRPMLDSVREARSGPGFTWPSAFPLTRPDHILIRGFRTAAASVRATTGSDHLAAIAALGAP
ncbi:endonuclease/exonuclease/phosphatase family protein [Amycolatopsis minnesotensis]